MDVDKLMQAVADNSHPQRVLRVIKAAAPAAGADPVFTIPGQTVCRPISIIGTLVTSAVVAARRVAMQVTDGNDVLGIALGGITQAASLTTQYSFFGSGNNSAAVAGQPLIASGMPDFVLPPGFTIGFKTGLIDVGDQWGASLLWVEEYLSQPFPTDLLQREAWVERMVLESAANQGV